MAIEPSSVAFFEEKDPRNLAIGVRAKLTMTDLFFSMVDYVVDVSVFIVCVSCHQVSKPFSSVNMLEILEISILSSHGSSRLSTLITTL